MNLDDQRAELKSVREEIANRTQELANRILDARILRARLEGEYRKGTRGVMCSSDTKAQDAAKVDPEYVQYERETARLKYECEIAQAEAESRAYAIQQEFVTTGSNALTGVMRALVDFKEITT